MQVKTKCVSKGPGLSIAELHWFVVFSDVAPSEETKLEAELEVEDDTELEKPIQKQERKTEIMVLSPASASKVISVITKQLLPQLHKVMAKKTTAETHHKLNRWSHDGL